MSGTVLVCGSAGFIGSHCVREFEATGWTVAHAGRGSPCAGDFTDRAYVAQLLAQSAPDCVLFAAGPSSVRQSFADPVSDFLAQAVPLLHVLDAARRSAKPPAIVLISSAAVYGNPREIPVGESAACAPISPYGFHKLQQEALVDEYARLYGLRTCKARVFSTYGAGLRQLAVWDITQRALQGDTTLEGSGGESRDYLHVADVARALECICRGAPLAGESINVASGEETTIESLAVLIYTQLGLKQRPTLRGKGEEGKPLRWRADISQLHALGFRPQVGLREGLAETLEWIRGHA